MDCTPISRIVEISDQIALHVYQSDKMLAIG